MIGRATPKWLVIPEECSSRNTLPLSCENSYGEETHLHRRANGEHVRWQLPWRRARMSVYDVLCETGEATREFVKLLFRVARVVVQFGNVRLA